MSWQIFKDNVLRYANNPDAIQDIDTVAKVYATEYDAAVKRGFDTVNNTAVTKGNVEAMTQLFKAALQKGLSSTADYDLVGEMGKGVIAYWSTQQAPTPLLPENQPPPTAIQMNRFPIPLVTIQQLVSGVTANIVVYSNIVTNPGKWIKPLTAINNNKILPF